MIKSITRILLFLAMVGLLAGVVVGLVAWSPFFSDYRRAKIEAFLSEQIGQPVRIDGDTALRIDGGIRFHVSDVVIPSVVIPEMDLANLERLEFDIAIHSWRPLDIWIDDLWVRGLFVDLLKDENGRESWEYSESASQTPDAFPDIVEFLRGVTFRFEDISLRSEDRQSGFDFNFNLEGLDFVLQEGRSSATLTGQGTINDELFEVGARFQKNGPFSGNFEFGQLNLEYSGTTNRAVAPTGHVAQLTVETDDLGNLLDVLKVERVLEGRGALSTNVIYSAGKWSFDDLGAQIRFQDGAELSASGAIGDLLKLRGVDIEVSGRLHPEGTPPRKTTILEKLVVTEFSGHLADLEDGLTVEELRVETNAAIREFDKLGPISVGRVFRMQEQIALEDLVVLAGPEQSPYLRLEGDVNDLLQFKQLRLTGESDLPAAVFLKGIVKTPERFGHVLADLELNDDSGEIALTNLQLSVEDSSIWALEQSASVGSIADIADIEYRLDLRIPNTADLLNEFGLSGFGARTLDLKLFSKGGVEDFTTRIDLKSGRTAMAARLQARLDTATPLLTGQVTSSLLDLADISYLISAIGGLQKLDFAELREAAETGELLPLVLENRNDPTDLQPLVLPGGAAREDPDLQPLVLPKDVPDRDDPTLQPLVVGSSRPSLDALETLLDADQLLRTAKARIAVNIDRIVGQPAISAVQSDLVLDRGRARIGPLNLGQGRGRASVTAGIDFIRTPQFISLSGRTDGWDIAQLTEPAGIPASGQVHGSFDLIGRNGSVDAFFDSMSGSARLTVAKGMIGTSLIELSGLGVLPWLFSKERVAGRSRIGCIVAPLEIRNGLVSSNAFVAETDTVQVVARGNIDLRRERIAVRADARPLGTPLSPSAWPVTLSGNLSSPNVELARSRVQRRADGAREMPAKRVPCKPDILQLQ